VKLVSLVDKSLIVSIEPNFKNQLINYFELENGEKQLIQLNNSPLLPSPFKFCTIISGKTTSQNYEYSYRTLTRNQPQRRLRGAHGGAHPLRRPAHR
jgi:hypothetical protein